MTSYILVYAFFLLPTITLVGSRKRKKKNDRTIVYNNVNRLLFKRSEINPTGDHHRTIELIMQTDLKNKIMLGDLRFIPRPIDTPLAKR